MEHEALDRPDQMAAVEAFIATWQGNEGGAERANYGLFLTKLTDLLGVPNPEPAGATTENNDYVFERAVKYRDGGMGRIDLYKRGSFVLEAKQSRQKGQPKAVPGQEDLLTAEVEAGRARGRADRAWDVLMMNARRQAEDYARALPASHDWPPFILVCDVGHVIEVYADFTGKGRNYTQFPDRQGFRVFLEDLRRPDIRERLRLIWTDPHALDPTKQAARATRQIAERLAQVSRLLEARGFAAEQVAHFLMRCLFTMFAEDVRLLPQDSFKDLLDRCRDKPENFPRMVGQLWEAMNKGGFAYGIETQVKRFNGEFFRDTTALPLNREEIGELHAAARADWKAVEPAIFGTLLEQALDAAERKRLGAHYTPRAYVERLVIATIIEPLREDWRNVQATAEKLKGQGRDQEATETVRAFHRQLCRTRVLDPACGTGNFLYVAMELMKRLEGEVLEALADLGGQEALRLERETVDPHQFLGLELNQRAVAIAELVLWIGYLQWHYRTKGEHPGEPILKPFRNIRYADAVLTWDGFPVPKAVDGKETYPNARRPEWPAAEFIVGNPPFIGGKDIRSRLGDGYAETLWKVHKQVNSSADYVMYWWDRAAELLTRKGTVLRRFGLVTTNSVTQVFQRRVVERHLKAAAPVSLLMAIPDHPWTKATKDAAAVRIAMTVVQAGVHQGVLREAVREAGLDTDDPTVELRETVGIVNANLSVGVDLTQSIPLRANEGLCSPGVKLHGAGFIVTPQEAQHLGLGRRDGLESHIRPYRHGRDIAARPRGVMVIDLDGLSSEAVRLRFPEVYQHLLMTVKPHRDKNNEEYRRINWWLFGRRNTLMRGFNADLDRYISTPETMKHRVFVFLDKSILPDNMLVNVGLDDAFHLGVLSSRIHVAWTLESGATLEDRPRYSKSRCFDPFPFPGPVDEALKADIRAKAEELDATRKRVLAEHPDLTLTRLYNVLERLRAGAAVAGFQPSPLVGEGGSRPRTSGAPQCAAQHPGDPGEGAGRRAESAQGLAPYDHPPIRAALTRGPPSPTRGEGMNSVAALTRGPPSPPRGEGMSEVPPLTDAERDIAERGLVLILKELHERIDALVAEAYGWPADLSEEEILARLVALNKERAAEERRGIVRWLRPDYQVPKLGTPKEREELELAGAATGQASRPAGKPRFPAGDVERTAAIFAMLAASAEPIDAAALAGRFRQGRQVEPQVRATLQALARMGHLAAQDGGSRFALRRAG